ncbi:MULTISPECIES: GlsB/YeaQ/YmgE family stress response membrane protein [unclassified Modestobacter]
MSSEVTTVLWNILVLIVIGALAGFIARAVIPGKQSMGILATVVLGIIGSFVGNLLGSLIFNGEFELGTSGVIGSIIGAIVVLGIYVAVTNKNRRVTR